MTSYALKLNEFLEIPGSRHLMHICFKSKPKLVELNFIVSRCDIPDSIPDHVVDIWSSTFLPRAFPGSVRSQGTPESVWQNGSCRQGPRVRHVDDQLPRGHLLQPHHCLDHLLHLCWLHFWTALDLLWKHKFYKCQLFSSEINQKS